MTGIYIHVPFCLRKCSYCDFYSVKFSEESAEAYTSAVIRNLRRYAPSADSVYFGGGTPTLLSPAQIGRVLNEIRLSDDAEVSMECNPKTADREKFAEYKSAGINRISVGVQSLIDRELSEVGRLHDSAEAVRCIGDIYSAGIDDISADIMLGLPYQTAETLTGTINGLLKLPVSHISAYMLTVEEGTPLSADDALLENIPDGDGLADLYLLTCDILEGAGFARYEISNFAKHGMECRHNLKYWKCEDYIGIGPAAHSCYKGKRYAVPRDIGAFIENDIQQEIVTDDEPLTEEERIMLALRLSVGIDPQEYSCTEQLIGRAEPLVKAGFLKKTNGRISLTDKGALVSNDIIVRLIE
ncbi:MAG: radical SAM family heme chaperone HemW [Oscillospiraceae bacterium]